MLGSCLSEEGRDYQHEDLLDHQRRQALVEQDEITPAVREGCKLGIGG